MNGIHDMGGMHGLGPIAHSPAEPVFHSEWEGRVFAMFLSVNGVGTLGTDEFRHSMERMNPLEYISGSYYEHWLAGVLTLLFEKNIITPAELAMRVVQLKEGNTCQ